MAKEGTHRHFEILDAIDGFQVRVVDANGDVLRRFTYRTIVDAQKAASAWATAYDNCEVRELMRPELREKPRT